jgi:hypothetical protein
MAESRGKYLNIKLWFYILILFQVPAVNLLAHVQLDYPRGGEIFEAGEIVSIHWRLLIPHNQENWDLYFSGDGGTSWEVIKLDIEVPEVSYQWTVPEIETENARIRIVQDNHNSDYEDISGNFTIMGNTTSVESQNENPDKIILRANYPNPFNPVTIIEYEIPDAAGYNFPAVNLKVYDSLGGEVTTLANGTHRPGIYKAEFDGSNLPSGIYIYKLTGFNQILTRKMILLK